MKSNLFLAVFVTLLIAACGKTPQPVSVSSVTIAPASLSITEGETRLLSVTILPEDATDQTVSWTSDNPSVATVADGEVTAVAVGNAIITATAGGKSAMCNVTVSKEEKPLVFNKYLTFTSEGSTTISLITDGSNTPVLYYSTDAITWSLWDYSKLSFDSQHPLYLCGDNPDGFSTKRGYSWFFATGDNYAATGDIMSLISYDRDITVIPSERCFYFLFDSRYGTGLTAAPYLPATTLTKSCYSYMFVGCNALVSAPPLPALSLAEACYESMFCDCTSLEVAPELPATSLAERCYAMMFRGCTSLKRAPELPATSMETMCYDAMFYQCTGLEYAPALPATSLAVACYSGMFHGCTSLEVAPALPATSLATGCYADMFYECKSMTLPPALPATTLAEACYEFMFSDCTSLTRSPDLPATSLAKYCYHYMFNRSGLTFAPEIPAIELAEFCCFGMFYDCIHLQGSPDLPATTLAKSCYHCMFDGCSALTNPPSLPATTLAIACYAGMFERCVSLTYAPALPATSLEEGCYSGMFEWCTNLINSPMLPATTLVRSCYCGMFDHCSRLSQVTCMATDISAPDCISLWLRDVPATGTFIKAKEMDNWPTGAAGIPEGWTILDIE